MPESHLEIAGSAGLGSLPTEWGFLPKRATPESSALAVNSHVRLKAMDLTPQSKPVWTWTHTEQLLLLWIMWWLPPGDTHELTAPLVRDRRNDG